MCKRRLLCYTFQALETQVIREKIAIQELKQIAENQFGDFVKAVVDIEKEIMAIGAELHADEETALLDEGSKQENLWGINLYVDEDKDDFVEFDSLINIRPSQGNKSRNVEDAAIRKKIQEIVLRMVER